MKAFRSLGSCGVWCTTCGKGSSCSALLLGNREVPGSERRACGSSASAHAVADNARIELWLRKSAISFGWKQCGPQLARSAPNRLATRGWQRRQRQADVLVDGWCLVRYKRAESEARAGSRGSAERELEARELGGLLKLVTYVDCSDWREASSSSVQPSLLDTG